eukprot:223150_1
MCRHPRRAGPGAAERPHQRVLQAVPAHQHLGRRRHQGRGGEEGRGDCLKSLRGLTSLCTYCKIRKPGEVPKADSSVHLEGGKEERRKTIYRELVAHFEDDDSEREEREDSS